MPIKDIWERIDHLTMNFHLQELTASGIKITLSEKGETIGRAFLYLLRNGLHDQPFGFMEDVFVEEQFRGKGYGPKIVEKVIEEAKKRNCYKLICTSRFSNEKAHKLYAKAGFREQGKEFRIDF